MMLYGFVVESLFFLFLQSNVNAVFIKDTISSEFFLRNDAPLDNLSNLSDDKGDNNGDDAALDIFRSLVEKYSDQLGTWLEFVSVSNNNIKKKYRISILKDKTIEFWFDGVGDEALQLREDSGKLVVDYLRDSRIYRFYGDVIEKKRSDNIAEYSEVIKQIDSQVKNISSATVKNEEFVEIATVLGKYQCQKIQAELFGKTIELYVSDVVPLLHIVKVDFSKDNSYEIVAFGKGAYSVFQSNVNVIMIDDILSMAKQLDSSNDQKKNDQKKVDQK